MIDRKLFFDSVRASLFAGKLSQGQVDGITLILNAWEAGQYCDDRQLAYMLATVYHETAKTMQPIAEIGKGRGREYGRHVKQSGKAYPARMPLYYGRGFVQLTWYENYEKAGKTLGHDLLNDPDLALNPVIATAILIRGMLDGWVTGKRLSDYFNGSKEDWVMARKIVNGLDRAPFHISHSGFVRFEKPRRAYSDW